MKSVSVIVTYYNSEDYIENCLNSLKIKGSKILN